MNLKTRHHLSSSFFTIPLSKIQQASAKVTRVQKVPLTSKVPNPCRQIGSNAKKEDLHKYISGPGPPRRLHKVEEDLDIIMAEDHHPPANYVTKVTFYAAFLTPDT